jgi:hypothetical protein
MPSVLHVGCGSKTLRQMPAYFQSGNWQEIRLDINPAVEPDVIGTMTDMSPVASGSVQAVFSSHNVEHLFPHEVPLALAEFRRVLDDDGFVLITCPDLQSVAKLVTEDRLLEPAYQSKMGPISPLDILYGHRASIAQGNHFMAHRGGFTMRSLAKALEEARFGRCLVKRRPANFDLWALGSVGNWTEHELSGKAHALFPQQN